MIFILENISLNEGSFIVELHEYSRFDAKKLDRLIEEIEELNKKTELNDLDVHLVFKKLFFIYCKLSDFLIAHFDPNDLFFIEDLNEDYNEYLNKFRLALEVLFEKLY